MTILEAQKARLSKMGKNGAKEEIESLKESLKTLESLKAQILKTNDCKLDGKAKESEKDLTIAYAIDNGDVHEISATSAQGLFKRICKDLTGAEPRYPSMALKGRTTFNFKGQFNEVLRLIRDCGCSVKAMPIFKSPAID